MWRVARWLASRDDNTLPVRIAVTSLKLRLEIVRQAHPEILDHPDIRGLVTALEADRQIAAARSLHRLLTTAGVEDALAAVAPVLTELLALNALLDENPFNDSLGWDIVGGRMPTVSPMNSTSGFVPGGMRVQLMPSQVMLLRPSNSKLTVCVSGVS